jgi:hypothetical protein
MVLLLGFVIDEISVKRELTDKMIDLTERQRWRALQLTADKTVFVHTEFEYGSASILNGSHAELLGQSKHAEDAANAGSPLRRWMALQKRPICVPARVARASN